MCLVGLVFLSLRIQFAATGLIVTQRQGKVYSSEVVLRPGGPLSDIASFYPVNVTTRLSMDLQATVLRTLPAPLPDYPMSNGLSRCRPSA